MEHACEHDCPCRMDIQAAADALAESSRLLAESIGHGFVDLIELRYALVRVSKSRLQGAIATYREHALQPAFQ